jgi:long-subunit acyl-CoA synthetase (AMP-forming)
VQYLWLPLAHSFGKVLEAIADQDRLRTGIDGRIDKLVDNLAAVKPTFVAAVPRIFEKVYNKVVAGAKDGGGLKYTIFKWAVEVGRQASKLRQQGKQPGACWPQVRHRRQAGVLQAARGASAAASSTSCRAVRPVARGAEFFHAANI